MNTIQKTLTTIAAIAIGVLVINTVYTMGIKQHCRNLLEQSIEQGGNPYFYITKLDHDECKANGISIKAPIYE